eukprot:TRINITY_DN5726_c0_g1_i1.p1 TRINITY_DN5726_c0_g1~~TRINITY_DN5726_c0_g1_i1.p1  ORF type:complete len:80 (+),score=9.25 TRINITY_DN5726_c0_g1_i1:408-647(+)
MKKSEIISPPPPLVQRFPFSKLRGGGASGIQRGDCRCFMMCGRLKSFQKGVSSNTPLLRVYGIHTKTIRDMFLTVLVFF